MPSKYQNSVETTLIFNMNLPLSSCSSRLCSECLSIGFKVEPDACRAWDCNIPWAYLSISNAVLAIRLSAKFHGPVLIDKCQARSIAYKGQPFHNPQCKKSGCPVFSPHDLSICTPRTQVIWNCIHHKKTKPSRLQQALFLVYNAHLAY